MVRSKNVKIVPKSFLKGLSKLVPGSSSSAGDNDVPDNKIRMGLSASVCTGDHTEDPNVPSSVGDVDLDVDVYMKRRENVEVGDVGGDVEQEGDEQEEGDDKEDEGDDDEEGESDCDDGGKGDDKGKGKAPVEEEDESDGDDGD